MGKRDCRRTGPVAAALLVSACASTETRVLPPYALANGRVLQDVVSVAADGSGGAPVITTLTTYDVNARDRTVILARETASAPGAGLMMADGLGSAVVTSAAILGAAAIVDEDGRGDVVNNNYNTARGGDARARGGGAGDGGIELNPTYSTSGNTARNGDAGDIDAVSALVTSGSISN